MKWFFGTDRNTRVELLRKQIAQHDADHTYHARMAMFYSEEMATLDPHKSPEEAQQFATAFKKQQDEYVDMNAAINDSREANAKLEAMQ